MKEGDQIYITDGLGNSASGNLGFEGKKVLLQHVKIEQNHPPLKPALHIAIAPTKNIDRTEFFLEKATELGAASLTFILTDNTERKNLNMDKLIRQSIAASKQSHRFHFPQIKGLIKLSEFLSSADPKTTFLAHCNEKMSRKSLYDIEHDGDVTFLIGPEGDFSKKEILMMADIGITAVTLGNQRLRTETAGIFVAAWNYQKTFQ